MPNPEKSLDQQAQEIVDKATQGTDVTGPLTPEIAEAVELKMKQLSDADRTKVSLALGKLKKEAGKKVIDAAMDKNIDTLATLKSELSEGMAALAELTKKYPDYMESFEGLFGSALLLRIQQGGRDCTLDSRGNVLISPTSKDVLEITTNINANPQLKKIVAKGLLQQSTVFSSYIQANTDNNGVVKNTSISNFGEYAKSYNSAGTTLSATDSNLLKSMSGLRAVYSNNSDFQRFVDGYVNSQNGIRNLVQQQNSMNTSQNTSQSTPTLSKPSLVNQAGGVVGGYAAEAAGMSAGFLGDFASGAFEKGGIFGGSITLFGMLFGLWKLFTADKITIPGLDKIPGFKDNTITGWQAGLLLVGGGPAAKMVYEYVFGKSVENIGTEAITQTEGNRLLLEASGLQEDAKKYGDIAVKLDKAKYSELKSWMSNPTSTAPGVIQEILSSEKDANKRSEKEKFIKNYIALLSSKNIPGLEEGLNIIMNQPGSENFTMGDIKNALIEEGRKRPKDAIALLDKIINDTTASDESKAWARNMKTKIEQGLKDGTSHKLEAAVMAGSVLALGNIWNLAKDYWDEAALAGGGGFTIWKLYKLLKKSPTALQQAGGLQAVAKSSFVGDVVLGAKATAEGVALARATGLERKLLSFQMVLSTDGLPANHFDELVDVAREIDQMQGAKNVFGNAKKANELNKKLFKIVSALDEDYVNHLLNHTDDSVKAIATVLKEMKVAAAAKKYSVIVITS